MRQPTAHLGLTLDAAPDVAAAAHAVVDHLAAEDRLLPSVYLDHGGRLRCAALRGSWQIRDGVDATAGIVGRSFSSGAETIVADVRADGAYLETTPDILSEACFPLTARGRTVGVLNVESREPLRPGDVELLRECALALAARIEVLGGLPAVSATQRLLRHVADMAALEDVDAIAGLLLDAALDLVPLGSALLVRAAGDGFAPLCATGPLAARLSEAPLDALVAWLRGGTSCFTVGGPDAPAVSELAPLRAAGVQSLVAVTLSVQREAVGMLLLAAEQALPVDGDDVELLEQLGAHGALCLRNAELMRSLRDRAASDPLTGLGHHATFHEALATSHRRPRTAVVLCDLDGFKRLNDTHGHAHGDRVLCSVADAMSGALRRGDRLFRVGGDEFAALLAVGSEDEALDAAIRLRDAVHEARLGVTISIGAAVPHDGEGDAELLARADRALYTVKAGGRDGVAVAAA
jgi:diguanylate cyclase (GGDEF)-like protein